jgi:hypothetical protein
MQPGAAPYDLTVMHWQRRLFAGLPGLLASGLIAFLPIRSHAQADGTAYTVIYEGVADFKSNTISGPKVGTKFHWHASWSATADGTNLTQDAQLAYSTSTSRFAETVVGPMTFTTLTGDLDVTTTGEPQGDRTCKANLLHLPDKMMNFALSMGPYQGIDGTYAVGVQIGEMPLSADYMKTDNTTEQYCIPAPARNAFSIDKFPDVPSSKVHEFQDARVPLIDVYPIDPSQPFDETRTKDFDYTGPATDPNSPAGTTIYQGSIHSSIRIRSYGPLVIQ